MSLPPFEQLNRIQKGLPPFNQLKPVAKNSTAAIDTQKPVAPQYGNPTKVKKLKPSPKPKTAQTLEAFRASSTSVGHALFYRYIRIPDHANDGLPGPKGGACILVNMVDQVKFYFTFAVCSTEDPFEKDKARKLCQDRWRRGTICAVTRRDPQASCYENILRAIYNYIDTTNPNAIEGEPRLEIYGGQQVSKQNLKLLTKTIENYYQSGV